MTLQCVFGKFMRLLDVFDPFHNSFLTLGVRPDVQPVESQNPLGENTWKQHRNYVAVFAVPTNHGPSPVLGFRNS